MEIPTVHLNGTDGDNLLDQVVNASHVAYDLLKALEDAAPNGRDYYVNGPGALKRAQLEHCSRVERVKSVWSELQEIAKGIADQNDRRRRTK